jgi:predicted O-methyltransferase YrrM
MLHSSHETTEDRAMATRSPNAPFEPPTCDDRLIWDVWLSIYHLRTLNVADRVGLFAMLHETPATVDEVAQRVSMSPRGTEAMLGTLAALGFLKQLDGTFHLTDVSRNFLLPDSPYYWGGAFRLTEDLPLTATVLHEALQRDTPKLVWRGDWEVHEEDAERARLFTAAMHSHSMPAAVGAARRGDFVGVRRLLDVGGGSGCFSIALAQIYRDVRCTVLDLPLVCRLAEKYAAEHGLSDRIDTVTANMFADVWPTGYDAVWFMNVFHDWERTTCLDLAQRAFDALPSGGRVYVHEILLDDTKDGPLAACAFSMKMAFAERGKQFTARELQELLLSAGFDRIEVTPTYGYYSLMTGWKR